MKKRASYAIFGMGRFGVSIAEVLLEAECEVMVIDRSEEHLQKIASQATYAIRADVTEEGVLESIGIGNVDVVIIAMAERLEASIMVAMYAKESGVSRIIAKCSSPLHGAILHKIGVDEVIYPEREMGKRVARNLLTGGFVDLVELSDNFSMVEVKAPAAWAGKSLAQLKIRDTYNINVVALKKGEQVCVNLDPHEPLEQGETLIMLGNNEDLNRLSDE